MIKEKGNKKLVRSLLIGSLLFIIGLSLIGYNKYKDISFKQNEKDMINDFFNKVEIANAEIKQTDNSTYIKNNKRKNSYMAIIEINSINLKTGLVNPKSKSNNVDKHIQIINGSDMPNVDKGNFILASHSGTSKVSYFRKLDKVKIGDKVKIYYQNTKYIYKIKNKYLLNKDGNIEIYRNKDVTTLTLTTCDTKSDTKQLVVIAELESKNTF